MTKAEAFFIRFKKQFTVVGIALIVLIGGYFAYRYLYLEPRSKQANNEIFYAQNYFALDSLDIALNGDGQHSGFLDIMDAYSGTPAANLSKYYAGVIYMKKGSFKEAIEYLKKFKTEDLMLRPLSISAIGDCYAELGDLKQALTYYTKASEKDANDLITPKILMKAAAVCEINGDYKQALTFYQQIQKEHTRSDEARDIDKYVSMTEARLQK